MSQQSFRALGVSAPVAEALASRGIHEPFRIQSLVLPDALAGADILAKSPTGSGKTLAFAAPIVERVAPGEPGPAALVLVPTRELAAQVAGELEPLARAKGLRVAAVYGGAPLPPQARRARAAHVVVATPGRMQDLVQRGLPLDRVRILVLDEADRMLDMGFRPQVERIVRRLPQARQTMLFSATLDGEVGELARAYTRNPARFAAQLQTVHDDKEIEHRFVSVTADGKVDRLIEELEADRGLVLVFVRTKRGAERLAEKLARRDVAAAAMHGDMSQGARERALQRFRAGKVRTLIATDVAARGLDLDDITHVINFDPPEDDKGYVHRVGRMRIQISSGAVRFLSAGRILEDDEQILLALLENRIDPKRLAFEIEHQRAGRGLVAGHAEDVGDGDFLRGLIRLVVRLNAKGRVDRKVIERFEILPRVALRVLDSNPETIAAHIGAFDHLKIHCAVADDRRPIWIGIVSERSIRQHRDMTIFQSEFRFCRRLRRKSDLIDAIVQPEKADERQPAVIAEQPSSSLRAPLLLFVINGRRLRDVLLLASREKKQNGEEAAHHRLA